ncbi:MAG: hypothetical protein KatS3mg110_3334 [Pirellulaceae bacterium]|nr:MAG: hypothetical protein KatS3mg110_3334 [Pirellulaceae bacterium]
MTSGTLAREISYWWDIGTRLVAASDPDSSYTLAYDDLDRLVSIDNQGTPNIPRVVLNSSYDASGNRTRLAAVIDGTDDFVNDYTYDLLNRMTRVEQYGVAGGHAVAEKRVDMAYNSLGQFTQIVRYRALSGTPSDEVATSVYTYDAAHRLVGLSHNRGGQPLFTPYGWTYDPLDRIIEMVNSDGTSVFTYDQTDQLTGADHSYQTDEAYQYDANGNRTGGGYVTGSNNQLLEDGTYRYEYDAEGNRTAKETIATGEREEYTWDHRNRLVRFLRKDAQGAIILDVHYSYDVFDRRIGKTVDPDGDGPQGPSFTWFVYDNPSVVTGASDPALVGADHIVLEFTGSQPATLKYRYLHGPVVDQVFAREDVDSLWQPGEVLWPLGDHLGTVRDLIDSSGNVLNHLRYEAFGRVTSETNAAVDFLFAYTGRERDEEPGLFYYRARYYDPAVGRFISEDPLGFAAGDGNTYRYVGNRPHSQTDPTGLVALDDWYSLLQHITRHTKPQITLAGGSTWNGPPNIKTGSLGYRTWYANFLSQSLAKPQPGYAGNGPPNMDATSRDYKGWYFAVIMAQFPPPPPPKPGLPFGIPGYIDINFGHLGFGGGVQIGSGPPGPFRWFPSVHPYYGAQTPGFAVTWSPNDITPGLNYGISGAISYLVLQGGPAFPAGGPPWPPQWYFEVGITSNPWTPGIGVWHVL